MAGGRGKRGGTQNETERRKWLGLTKSKLQDMNYGVLIPSSSSTLNILFLQKLAECSNTTGPGSRPALTAQPGPEPARTEEKLAVPFPSPSSCPPGTGCGPAPQQAVLNAQILLLLKNLCAWMPHEHVTRISPCIL